MVQWWQSATSWWDTGGAIALVGALSTLAGIAIGSLLQPIVQRRIRKERARDEWTERARTAAVEIDRILVSLALDSADPAAQEAAVEYRDHVERSMVMIARFYPVTSVRKVADSVVAFTNQCAKRTLSASAAKDDDIRQKLDTFRKEDLGEAVFALEKLVELLGGPEARAREESTLSMRSDRSATFRQAWEKNAKDESQPDRQNR